MSSSSTAAPCTATSPRTARPSRTLLDAVRVELAEQYLLNGRYSLSDISALLGFAAPSGFSRWFRQRYGCSATEWRAERSAVPG